MVGYVTGLEYHGDNIHRCGILSWDVFMGWGCYDRVLTWNVACSVDKGCYV